MRKKIEALLNLSVKSWTPVFLERVRQHTLWGVQEHPITVEGRLRMWRLYGTKLVALSKPQDSWTDILMEEVGEMLEKLPRNEKDIPAFCEELTQVAAVCLQILEAIDRKS